MVISYSNIYPADFISMQLNKKKTFNEAKLDTKKGPVYHNIYIVYWTS